MMNRKSILAHNQITVVIDPSHKEWVLGGLFREVIESTPEFFELEMHAIPPLRGIASVTRWIKKSFLLRKRDFLLFTSLTPLVNYMKSNLARENQKIAIWYTHKVGNFNNLELRALRRANVIFAHSERDFASLRKVTDAELIPVLGAIDRKRFVNATQIGSEIAWIGMPAERKRPEILFDLADSIPEQRFRLIGRGWKESSYWKEVIRRQNISYKELDEPLRSEMLDGCCVLLVTSSCEGGPMPLMESIASGLYPISTDVGFVREVFTLAGIDSKFIVEAKVADFLNCIDDAKEQCMIMRDFRREAMLGFTMERMALIIYQNLCKEESDFRD